MSWHLQSLWNQPKHSHYTWLVVWNMFYFSIHLGISSSQLTHSIIFQRGRYTSNQKMIDISIIINPGDDDVHRSLNPSGFTHHLIASDRSYFWRPNHLNHTCHSCGWCIAFRCRHHPWPVLGQSCQWHLRAKGGEKPRRLKPQKCVGEKCGEWKNDLCM